MVEEAVFVVINRVEGLGAGDGVGGTTIGVEGCSATLEIVRVTGVLVAGDDQLFEFAGLASTPNELTSTPSRSTTVPSAFKACSKSRSVREIRRLPCLLVKSSEAIGCSPKG